MIEYIYLKENAVKMMVPYNPEEPLSQLIEQLENRKEFARAGDQKISDAIMVSKGITLLAQMGISDDDIQEWRRQSTDLKMWTKYEFFFHQEHWYQKRAVIAAGKGGYTAKMQNIYGVPPPLTEEHHEVI